MIFAAALFICFAPTASDGDTARCGLTRASYRLFAVDANETGTAGAFEAKVAHQAEANGGVHCAPAPYGPVTSYNRIVGICFNFKGEDIARKLLIAGHVKEDCRPRAAGGYSISAAYPRGYYGTCLAVTP